MRGASIDWESIARGMVDFTTPFTIPAEIITNTISAYAYRGRENLMSVTLPDSLTTIKESAFYGCKGLTSIVIPNSVTLIETRAFQFCTSLTSAVVGSGITAIPTFMFSDCSLLATIDLPNTITTIGRESFYGCAFVNLTVPSAVTSIGQYAFANCRSLGGLVMSPTTPPTLDNANAFNSTNNCPIYVPDASVATYKAANNWSTYASRIFPISDLNNT